MAIGIATALGSAGYLGLRALSNPAARRLLMIGGKKLLKKGVEKGSTFAAQKVLPALRTSAKRGYKVPSVKENLGNIGGKINRNLIKLEPIRKPMKFTRTGKYSKKAYKRLSDAGKLKRNIEMKRVKGWPLARNLARLQAQGMVIEGVAKKGIGTYKSLRGTDAKGLKIKELKAQRQQAVEAQALIESLDKKEKLQAEQFLATKQKERELEGLPAENTIQDVREAVSTQVEQRVIPEAGIPTVEDDGGRAEWLAKSANSPAAKAGFSDDERWALQQKHRAWKKGRKKKRK
tara:strand:+ start:524 stop:1393 length:870 start_codon:yes stop_codon:yes gene_type:complete